MIDSLFILGEDKQIIIEKHWKGIVRREVLESYYSSLSECINSDVRYILKLTLACRMSLQFLKVATTRWFLQRKTIWCLLLL